jgi:hypothetical protein
VLNRKSRGATVGQPIESKFLAAAVQAEPIYFNVLKTAEKAAALIDDAGRQATRKNLTQQ